MDICRVGCPTGKFYCNCEEVALDPDTRERNVVPSENVYGTGCRTRLHWQLRFSFSRYFEGGPKERERKGGENYEQELWVGDATLLRFWSGIPLWWWGARLFVTESTDVVVYCLYTHVLDQDREPEVFKESWVSNTWSLLFVCFWSEKTGKDLRSGCF